MAVGAVVGAAIGTATAWALKFDKSEMAAGIYGFNSALVGIATLFFFQPGPMSIGLLVVGCVAGGAGDLADAAVRAVPDVHRAVHRHDLGPVLPGAWPWARARVEPGGPLEWVGLHSGRGPRCQPGDVPGERLDGAAVSRSASPSTTGSTRAWVLAGLDRRHAGGRATMRSRLREPSTLRASSIAACPRTSRSGSTATTRRSRPSPCSCGGGR